jgi:hypothetical protein
MSNDPDNSQDLPEQNDAEPSAAEFRVALCTVLTNLADKAKTAAREREDWQDLFKASTGGVQLLLSEANRKISLVLHSLADVLAIKHGLEHIDHETWLLLKAMPYVFPQLRDNIQDEQGLGCCADKARLLYAELVLESLKKNHKVPEETGEPPSAE